MGEHDSGWHWQMVSNLYLISILVYVCVIYFCQNSLVAPFSGLRRFLEGQGFKQWTGDDSKALMKVSYFFSHKKQLSSVLGLVTHHWWLCSCTNDADYSCFSRILLYYTTRSHQHTISQRGTLMLSSQLCNIEECGIHTNGFNLPWQDFLVHYPALIQVFGSPNGLCSWITKSKHIKAVKQPWWHSSCYKALGQMLLTNQHLDKMATCHADFTSCRMLDETLISGSNLYKLLYKMLTTVLLIKMTNIMMEEMLLDQPYLLK